MKNSKIPDYPKIPALGYVTRLSDKIRVVTDKDIISGFVSETHLNHISSRLGLSKSTLRDYFRRGRFPLFFLKEVDRLTKKDVFKIIESSELLFVSKKRLNKFPKFITPKLAYFVGYLQGDGSIEANRKRINFTDEYYEQITHINKICFELFGIAGRIERKLSKLSKKHMCRLEIGSLVLNSYLYSFFNINRGIKRNLRIPTLFNNKEILRWYLVGLFDADGTLPKSPEKCKQLFIDLTFKDKKFIEGIRKSLQFFGVKTLKPYCRVSKSPHSDYISKTWELRIRRKEDIITFLNEVGFTHSDKKKRVIRLLKYLGQ